MIGSGIRIKGFLLQYKIVEKYDRLSKIENFKFKLYPAYKYRQHNKLCKYNKIGKFSAAYCLPNFVTMDDLYSNLKSRNLLSNSILIFPTIPISNNSSHYITFGKLSAHQHSSEQNECDIKNLAQMLEERDADQLMIPEEFVEILKQIDSEIIENETEKARQYNCGNSFLVAYKIIE